VQSHLYRYSDGTSESINKKGSPMITAAIAADQIRRITHSVSQSARPEAPVVPAPRTRRKR
jgi:hypothetical protein